jgi:6-phosphogluconate dehydrogenase
MAKQQFGLVGLAVMGENLVLNIESRGFSVAVFNRTAEKTKAFAEGRAAGKNILPTYTFEELVGALERPRKIMLMVKAGQPVDDMIDQIKPHLEAGDILIDGGNSHYPDTERRSKALAADGILYIGTGVSGGESGALNGPAIMPGGAKEAYEAIEPIVTQIAAQTEDGACVTYVGPRSAGHFVKMVHNGIEYGDMELIAEAYNILKSALSLSPAQIQEIFGGWKDGLMDSYLMDITYDILGTTDPDTGEPLVEKILDKAGQKGTGKWTSQAALDLGVPTPTIDSAVSARIISAFKDERVAAEKILTGPDEKYVGDAHALIDAIHDAMYCSKICSYAQGFALMRGASAEYDYGLNFQEIARIWKGGCIIRAAFLDDIKEAFRRNPELPNLMVDAFFAKALNDRQDNWRFAVQTAQGLGIPLPAFAASLNYFDSYRHARVPANMIQAQRDYFGAHTYKRLDKDGDFHTEWEV